MSDGLGSLNDLLSRKCTSCPSPIVGLGQPNVGCGPHQRFADPPSTPPEGYLPEVSAKGTYLSLLGNVGTCVPAAPLL